MHKQLVGVW